MKIQTFMQHLLSVLIGAYIVGFLIAFWNHFPSDSGYILLGMLLVLVPPLYKILEVSK